MSQIFLHGDSTEDKLVAIVVPDEDVAKIWRDGLQTSDSTQTDLEQLEQAVLEQMMETGRRLGLKGYELVYAGKYTFRLTK